jgi:hypothetical protein
VRSTPSPLCRLQLGFHGRTELATPHLSVDGMTPHGPNLSHWPGNRTPRQWRADLSTAIALRCQRGDLAEQAAFLGAAELVVNDHYDTDGFGSLLAVLRPELAERHEELLLAAAATGDFGCWQSRRAFAVDRLVARLAHRDSPVVGEFAGLTDPDQRSLARYRWLLEHADAVLRAPEAFAAVYRDELAQVEAELDAGLRGAVQRQHFPAHDFAVLASAGPRHRLVLNTLAGAFRVLHVQQGREGCCYRYHDRTESWFDLVSIQARPRVDLRPLAAALAAAEGGGASWCADPPTEPIPELWCGDPAPQEYGQITRVLRPSRLAPEVVVERFVGHFAAASG